MKVARPVRRGEVGCPLAGVTPPTLHYDTGRFVRAIGFYLTDEAAIAAVRRANRLFERLQRHRRSVDSVLYEGGRYRAFSFTGLPPARFPAERPRYQ